MLTHDINLFPSRRDEKWKYSDLRSSLKHLSDGIEDENKPNFLLPDGLILEEVDCEFSSVKNISSALAENYCNKAWKINVPESFKSDQSLIISNLNSGHSRIIININTVSYTHLRAHETPEHLVCRLLLEKKKKKTIKKIF